MKTKTLIIFSAMFIMFVFGGSLIAQALNPDIQQGKVPGSANLGLPNAPQNTAEGIAGIVVTIVKWTYTIFFIIAVLYVLFAAYGYLAGADNPEAVSKAHKQLMYAAIAVIVALLAVSFNVIVSSLITSSSGTGTGTYQSGGVDSQTQSCNIGYTYDYGEGECIKDEEEGLPDFGAQG